MPAKSKAQQEAAGAALAAKRGDRPKSSLKGASKSMASSMSEKELEKMASTSARVSPSTRAEHSYFQPPALAAFSAAASKGSPAMVESIKAARLGSMPPAMR